MRKQEKKKSRILSIIKEHIYRNLKQYTIVAIFFLIGTIAGVIFANYTEEQTQVQMGNTITTFIECLKTDYQINFTNLLKEVMLNHLFFVFLLWFMGCTIIGIPIVYALVVFKGFSLGYTISSVIVALGSIKGSLFCILTLLLQNLLIIPSILALAVSCIKLYQAIMKNKKRENIKLEIVRHTIFCFFILICFIVSSFIEVYGSNFLFSLCVSWF